MNKSRRADGNGLRYGARAKRVRVLTKLEPSPFKTLDAYRAGMRARGDINPPPIEIDIPGDWNGPPSSIIRMAAHCRLTLGYTGNPRDGFAVRMWGGEDDKGRPVFKGEALMFFPNKGTLGE